MAAIYKVSIAIILVMVIHHSFLSFVSCLDNNRIYNCYDEFCHQHSHSCSQKTTQCRYCRDNTYGPFCNLCKDGYYGNATASKYGCKRCPCPYTQSNGTCDHNTTNNSLKCLKCLEGYHGDLCNKCNEGYYKIIKTGLCRPCDCNGHGNETLKQQCDPVGGKCFQCFHNTNGTHCQQCIRDYRIKKNKNNTRHCVPCNCNNNSQAGIAPICDWQTGICIACTPNTTGIHCQKCAQGYKGDAIIAKNCTFIDLPIKYKKHSKSKQVLIALVTSLMIIIASVAVSVCVFICWRRRKSRDPLGFITINMNHVDEDDYNISWIDPVTGDPILHNEVNTELPNGNLELVDEYNVELDDHPGEFESRDTDRML